MEVLFDPLRLGRNGHCDRLQDTQNGTYMSTSSSTGEPPSDSIRLEVEGMHCSSCVSHVERALKSVDGVEEAVVSLADSTAQVTGVGL